MNRNDTIKTIRDNLKRRSGKAWSVTGGTGTAYGWITIDSPPKRRTAHSRLKPGATTTWPEDYETVDTGEPGGYTTDADRKELAALLGLEAAHCQGVSIPSGNDYYQEYLDRSAGITPTRHGTPYWD